MKASTHTEIYRRFDGELRPHPLPFWTIGWSGVKLGFKKKLPLLLLLAPPVLMSAVFSFLVYLKFTLEAGKVPGVDQGSIQLVTMATNTLLAVSQQIVDFVVNVRFFALLAITWWGAGLIAEDRRLGAHLLYFSRPISRFDYLLGKLFTASFYGACALLVPAISICVVAAFSSPDWSFVKQQSDVIVGTIVFCSLWILVVSALVLAVSSIVERKGLALAAVFGVVFLSEAISNVLARLTDEAGWRLLSLVMNFERIADWIFDRPKKYDWSAQSSLLAIAIVFVVSLVILWRRTSRLEVVA